MAILIAVRTSAPMDSAIHGALPAWLETIPVSGLVPSCDENTAPWAHRHSNDDKSLEYLETRMGELATCLSDAIMGHQSRTLFDC